MPAENSKRETQPPETRGRRGWIDVSAARPVSTSQQTGDGDVKPHQPSVEASQRGTEAQCHVGNDASEHTAETGFSPVLLASVVHGEVELCVLASSLRRQVERQRSTPKTEQNGYNPSLAPTVHAMLTMGPDEEEEVTVTSSVYGKHSRQYSVMGSFNYCSY